MKNIISALLEAQKQIKNAEKDAKNPHFKNTYATLESVLDAVKEIANSCGLVILQSCGKDTEGHFLETTIFHTSGESVASKVYFVLDKNNMQGLGSCITYARRYSLASMFAIGQYDDDGNEASKVSQVNYTSSLNKPAPVIQGVAKASPELPPMWNKDELAEDNKKELEMFKSARIKANWSSADAVALCKSKYKKENPKQLTKSELLEAIEFMSLDVKG